MEDEILTVPEVSKYLKLSVSKTYQLVQQGVIPCLRLGKSVRVRLSDLEGWIEKNITSAD